MKCLRIYASADGESHFDEIELPTTKRSVHPDAVPFDVTASYPTSRVRLTHIPAGMRPVAWHTVPEPVLTVRLDGSVDYETSDGEVPMFRLAALCWLRIRTARVTCRVTPLKRKLSSGFPCRTASNYRLPRSHSKTSAKMLHFCNPDNP
jgi:hypothetical protein